MNAAIYLRTSANPDKPYRLSLDGQKKEATRFAEKQGHKVWGYYVDQDDSGQPQLAQLLKDAKEGKFEVVVVTSLDRLSPHFPTLLSIVRILAEMDVAVRSVTEDFDTKAPHTRFMVNLFGKAKTDAGRRISMSMEKTASEGYHLSKGPLGYRFDGKTLKPGKGANKIRKLFRDYLSGLGRRILSRKYRISTSTIRYILQNPVYAGMIRWKGKLVRGRHKPLISTATFEQAQNLMESRKV